VALDRPRLLHGRSEFGYTDRLQSALPEEPEAVSREEQTRLTLRVRRGEEERLREAWRAAHSGISDAIADFRSAGQLPPPVASDLRVIGRLADRLDRRLGL
jgi:hypothetical protein